MGHRQIAATRSAARIVCPRRIRPCRLPMAISSSVRPIRNCWLTFLEVVQRPELNSDPRFIHQCPARDQPNRADRGIAADAGTAHGARMGRGAVGAPACLRGPDLQLRAGARERSRGAREMVPTAVMALSNFAASTTALAQEAKDAKVVHCYGVNSCKGMSDCKSGKHDCKGMNDCKGRGFQGAFVQGLHGAGRQPRRSPRRLIVTGPVSARRPRCSGASPHAEYASIRAGSSQASLRVTSSMARRWPSISSR